MIRYIGKLDCMSIKTFIASVIFSAILSLIAWVLLLVYVDPGKIEGWRLVLFYAVLFLFCISLFLLIGLWGRKLAAGKRLNISAFMNSFRQSVLFSLLLVGILILQSFQLLAWWNGLLLVGAIVFLEFCFLAC